MADLYQSLSHSKWDCKYYVVLVFIAILRHYALKIWDVENQISRPIMCAPSKSQCRMHPTVFAA
jgi:hypothetical protein